MSTIVIDPIKEYYISKLQSIPEVKLFFIRINDDTLDIWVFVLSNDIELRYNISKFNKDVLNRWNDIEFEFMIIPITSIKELKQWENEIKQSITHEYLNP